MYRELLGDVRFFELLLRVDEERAAKVQALGCQHCGGRLHAARTSSASRGGPCWVARRLRLDLPSGSTGAAASAAGGRCRHP